MQIKINKLKEFKKKLQERENEFEAKIGFLLCKLLENIKFLKVEIHSQHRITLPNNDSVFDYLLKIKHKNRVEWILIELKDYQDSSLLPPQAQKFAEKCSLVEQKFPDLGVYKLLIIEDLNDPLPTSLTDACINNHIILRTYCQVKSLSEQIDAIGGDYALLEYLKNTFALSILFDGDDHVVVKAIKNTFGNRVNYTFTLPVEKLLPLSYVFRATSTMGDSNLEEAYQRSIDTKRLPKIRRFILSDHIAAMFPTNIVACIPINAKASLEEHEDGIVDIKLPNQYGTLQIIDGQHRLFSLAKCTDAELNKLKEYPFLVTLYHELETKDQARIFFSINDEQAGINPNLICYILSRLLEDKEGYAAYIALQLQTTNIFDKDLYDGIGKKAGRWLNLKTFVNNIAPSCDYKEKLNLVNFSSDNKKHGWLQKHSKDIETPVEILKIFFDIIKKTFPTDWKKRNKGFCQSNAGIAVWLRVLLIIAKKHATIDTFAENFTKSWLSKYFKKCDYRILNKKIDEFEADEWRRARNSSEYQMIADHIWDKIG